LLLALIQYRNFTLKHTNDEWSKSFNCQWVFWDNYYPDTQMQAVSKQEAKEIIGYILEDRPF
jgi:hypothetical protein